MMMWCYLMWSWRDAVAQTQNRNWMLESHHDDDHRWMYCVMWKLPEKPNYNAATPTITAPHCYDCKTTAEKNKMIRCILILHRIPPSILFKEVKVSTFLSNDKIVELTVFFGSLKQRTRVLQQHEPQLQDTGQELLNPLFNLVNCLCYFLDLFFFMLLSIEENRMVQSKKKIKLISLAYSFWLSITWKRGQEFAWLTNLHWNSELNGKAQKVCWELRKTTHPYHHVHLVEEKRFIMRETMDGRCSQLVLVLSV